MVFSDNVFLQKGLKNYWEKTWDDSLTLATIHNDTWNVLNVQQVQK